MKHYFIFSLALIAAALFSCKQEKVQTSLQKDLITSEISEHCAYNARSATCV